VPVGAQLGIADQHFGAAEERNSAINACRYSVGRAKLSGDVISVAVMGIVKPAVGPMPSTVGPQPPKDRQATQRALPQFRIGVEMVNIGPPSCVRGLASHTILPHGSPLQSKTCMATLFASNHVNSGTSHEAGRL